MGCGLWAVGRAAAAQAGGSPRAAAAHGQCRGEGGRAPPGIAPAPPRHRTGTAPASRGSAVPAAAAGGVAGRARR